MKFNLLDADGQVLERNRHLLSLKDMNLNSHLDMLIAAGATSFKIEGRLKDLSYVKNVTAAYSERLNEFIRHNPTYCRASRGHVTYTFKPDLKRTFNRGYTTYFLKGRQPDIASFDTPKAIGEYVGQVKQLRRDSLTVAGIASFANGDGLCFLNAERELEGFRVNRVEGNRLFPLTMPQSLHPGVRLYHRIKYIFRGNVRIATTTRSSSASCRVRVPCARFPSPCRCNLLTTVSRCLPIR